MKEERALGKALWLSRLPWSQFALIECPQRVAKCRRCAVNKMMILCELMRQFQLMIIVQRLIDDNN